jgi:hypothetical protein
MYAGAQGGQRAWWEHREAEGCDRRSSGSHQHRGLSNTMDSKRYSPESLLLKCILEEEWV